MSDLHYYMRNPLLVDNPELSPEILEEIYNYCMNPWIFHPYEKKKVIKVLSYKVLSNPNCYKGILKSKLRSSIKWLLKEWHDSLIGKFHYGDRGVPVIQMNIVYINCILYNPVFPLLLLENPNLVDYLEKDVKGKDTSSFIELLKPYHPHSTLINWLRSSK